MIVLRKKETRSMRELEFRIDAYGIYLLASDIHPQYGDHGLIAGISYQYPRWFSNLFCKHKQGAKNDIILRNNLRLFNWG